MPLFRFHQASLKDSLQTTIIVKNQDELLTAIKNHYQECANISDFEIERIESYPPDLGFDKRIGWYTQVVVIRSPEHLKSSFVAGFLSEPF